LRLVAPARSRSRKSESLEELRSKLDEINLELLRILSRRAAITIKVGELKRASGAPIHQPGRERLIIDCLIARNPGPLSAEQVRKIFTEIISVGSALQREVRIAYLGPEHTYAHQAATAHFGKSLAFVGEASITNVFGALDSGRVDYGVVPVENSTEGSVRPTLDLLIDTPWHIVAEILLPIKQALMSRSGEPGAIRKIVSHEQSLAQCRHYLAANYPHCEQEAVASNAAAALRAVEDASCAAIASVGAAAGYGLQVIEAGIQDLAQNTTRFLVLGKSPSAPSGKDKTSILFAVSDKVGALNQALAIFARNSINITKIESRPLRSRPWEYLFFLDLQGHRERAGLSRALASLKRKTLFLKVLGSYPEARPIGA